MEKSTGGVSFDIRFIDSSNSSENYSSVESRRLIGIYDGDWSLEEDGTVNASMAFARRVGDIRSHGNLIEKVRGIGLLRVSLRIKWMNLFLVFMAMWILAASGENIRR